MDWDHSTTGLRVEQLSRGEIEKAVREVRAQGLLVVSLNMAGSVPETPDLVVTNPVQAGVMTVMAVVEHGEVHGRASEAPRVLILRIQRKFSTSIRSLPE